MNKKLNLLIFIFFLILQTGCSDLIEKNKLNKEEKKMQRKAFSMAVPLAVELPDDASITKSPMIKEMQKKLLEEQKQKQEETN